MHMAMAIRSCSNHSPPFPNMPFSSYSTKPHLCISSYATLPLHAQSSSHYSCSALQQDTLVVTGGGIPPLAGAATPSPRRILERESGCDEATIRRKRRRRRKRRNTLERIYNDDDEEEEEDEIVFSNKKAGKSRFMSPKEEARFSWYLKERARVEAARRELVAEKGGDEVSSNEWAKAAGISRRKLDKILWNGRESEKRIISCYHGLVVSIASSYLGRGLSLQDLAQHRPSSRGDQIRSRKGLQAINIRLLVDQAIHHKSSSKQVEDGQITASHVQGSISELIPKIYEASNALSRELRRFPTHQEIAEAMEVNAEAVRLAIERNRAPISLDEAMTSHGYMSLQDIIAGPEELNPEAMMKKELVRAEMGKLLEALCEREARILRLHYGLGGESVWSFEEIGRLLKLSRERVRQINSAALAKLRQEDHLKYFIY
ncbi:RNA polymerase sigma factor sigD, chloroplastic-like isoform X1 [Salvia miltiorrhiza]|uniref:RNA polymerase sigma factor sigD, chloroplastic-like isoform X1 n=1 Tax=Salvia miltiorrhiza TaxID=226208 RepID=UPI0025AB76D4|nr:RNA polymerase sigma factor sigD, chloroplastic-like isoform X1 [Salvia miltiorrhiza]